MHIKEREREKKTTCMHAIRTMASKSRITPFTITPIYQDDVDKPWVTMESVIALSVWMNPNTNMTLENVAMMIEEFTATQIREQFEDNIMRSCIVYQGIVTSMTFRGEKIDRTQFGNCRAKERMRNRESFNLLMTQATSMCCTLI